MKLIKKVALPTLLGALLGLGVHCSSQAFPGSITKPKAVSGLLGALVGSGIGLALYLDELHTWKSNPEKKKNDRPCWYNFVGWGAVVGGIVGFNIHEYTERSLIMDLDDNDKKAVWGSLEKPPSRTTPHDVLKIKQGASEDEIRAAFGKRCLESHPDKNPTGVRCSIGTLKAARDLLLSELR